jgi:hypothetical protein
MQHVTEGDRQYRRGVVLGLTMAEIMLLLIFLLMLLLAFKLAEEQKARLALSQTLSSRDAELHSKEDELKKAQQELQEASAREEQFKKVNASAYSITKDLVRANKENDELKKERDKAESELQSAKLLLDLTDKLKERDPSLSDDAAASRIQELSEEGAKLEDVAMKLFPNLEPADALQAMTDMATAAQSMYPEDQPDEAIGEMKRHAAIGKAISETGKSPEELLSAAASCSDDLKLCKGQVGNLSRRLGGTLPPCWVDDTGKGQYIFDATLADEGIYLKDNKVPGKEEEQSNLPIENLRFGSPYEAQDFSNAGRPLRVWSDEHQCRFYVRLIDETGEDMKETYKKLRDSVETVFYIFQVR